MLEPAIPHADNHAHPDPLDRPPDPYDDCGPPLFAAVVEAAHRSGRSLDLADIARSAAYDPNRHRPTIRLAYTTWDLEVKSIGSSIAGSPSGTLTPVTRFAGVSA